MTKPQLLFDSNIIYKFIRELPQTAVDKLVEGSTIYLAYYELGNALWRECLLLKRISIDEAQKSLDLMYSILGHMQVASLDSETGGEVLQTAYKFNLTFYDTAYLVEAKKTGKTLVTDDNRLARAAENLGIKTASSKTLMQ
jgi:predicted nucleic acid-binding protein